MDSWKPDRILKLLVYWVTYLLIFSWLPLVRVVMDGESYRWGTSHFGRAFSSAGWGPDAWFLVFKSALLIGLLAGALRGAGPLFRQVLIFWALLFAADVVHATISDPGGFEFHGDTLGIHLNLSWPWIGVTILFTVLAIYWVRRETSAGAERRIIPWTRRNRALQFLFGALLPLQFALLRSGEPHGLTDQIGVLITIASCPLLAAALWPWRQRI